MSSEAQAVYFGLLPLEMDPMPDSGAGRPDAAGPVDPATARFRAAFLRVFKRPL